MRHRSPTLTHRYVIVVNMARSVDHPHGTRQRYQGARCRCSECTEANTRYQRLYRERTTPSYGHVEGTTRRGTRFHQLTMV